MERLIARHQMQSDDGTHYEVLEYQEFLDASSHDGAAMVPGMKSLFLADGTRVNHIDDDTFELIWPKTILRRIV